MNKKMVEFKDQWQWFALHCCPAIPGLHSVMRDMNMVMDPRKRLVLVCAYNLKSWFVFKSLFSFISGNLGAKDSDSNER